MTSSVSTERTGLGPFLAALGLATVCGLIIAGVWTDEFPSQSEKIGHGWKVFLTFCFGAFLLVSLYLALLGWGKYRRSRSREI